MKTVVIFLIFFSCFGIYSPNSLLSAPCDPYPDGSCGYGTEDYGCECDEYREITAKSNGGFTGTDCGRYQCVDYVQRFYERHFGINISGIGVAQNIYPMASQFDLYAYPNGGDVKPQPDDILVFAHENGFGHVAIITNVTQGSVDFIEQNWPGGCTDSLPMDPEEASVGRYRVADRGDYTVIGWVTFAPKTCADLESLVPQLYEEILQGQEDYLGYFCEDIYFDPPNQYTISVYVMEGMVGYWGYKIFSADVNLDRDNPKVLGWSDETIFPNTPDVEPSTGSWPSSPQSVAVTCPKAEIVFYTIEYTTDGSEPEEPGAPSESLKDGSISISHGTGTFQVWASPGQYKRLKAKFRGYNSAGLGPVSNTFSYSIDNRVNAPPGTPTADPSDTWTTSEHNVNVSCANAQRIYCTLRSAIDTIPSENPPEPTVESHDPVDRDGDNYIDHITGDQGTFKVWGEPGHKKYVKVRFRGWKEGDIYGDTSGIYLYEIDLTGGSDPGDDGTTPDGPDGNVKMLEISDDGTHWHHSYNAHPGQNLETEITITNKGDETIDYFEVFVHRSNDLYFDHNNDYSYGREEETDDLDPGDSDKKHRSIQAPSTPGTYYIFAYINRVDGKLGGTDQNWVNNYSRNDDKEEYAKLVVYPLPPPDKSIIKEESSSIIYIFYNNKKWRTTSGSIISALGFDSNNLITYPDGTLSQYSDGPDVMSEGLLGQLGSTIYLFEGGKWHYLPDWSYMDCRGGQHPENVFPITSALFGMYASGEDLTPCVPPPVADFTASSQETTTLDEVQLTDTSTNQISSWYWDFGDGETSTQQHPNHTYRCPGTYLVQLTVTGPGGSDQRFFYITVTYPPPLPGAFALSGKVTVNGSPWQDSGVTVKAYAQSSSERPENSVSTCSGGNYRMPLLPGSYRLQVVFGISKDLGNGPWTYNRMDYTAIENLEIADDTVLDIPITLYTLTGRITDPNGVGIPDVYICDYHAVMHTTTAADGSYVFYVVPGTYDLYLYPPEGNRFVDTKLNVNVSGNTTKDIVLEEQFLLQGAATIDGEPLDYHTINAYSQSSSKLINSVSVRDGKYQMALPSGTYQIGVGVNSGLIFIQNLEIVEDTTLDIPIALYTLTGKVTDSNGVGIPDVDIQGYLTGTKTTAADGSYTLPCPTGSQTLHINPPEQAGFTPTTIDVNISGNTVQDIVLEEQQFLLQGTVTINSESPPPFLVVVATTQTLNPNDLDPTSIFTSYNSFPRDHCALVESGGHYQMALPPGTWKVFVELPVSGIQQHMKFSYKAAENLEIVGDTTLDIPITFNKLTVKVIDINNSGIPGVGIGYYYAYYNTWDEQYNAADGSYTFYCPDGIYNLFAHAPAQLFPIAEIKKLHIFGDTHRNIILGDKGVLDEAIALLPSNLELHLDVFDIIDRNTMKPYNLAVPSPKDTLEIMLNWGGSEMLLKVYRPDDSLYGQWQSGSPPIIVNIPNPQVGTWKCEVTAVDIPSDNYPFALVAGISPNKQPVATIGGPYSGQPNSPITFDAGGSYDPDGTIALYEWDWNNDGTFDQSSISPTVEHTWNVSYNGSINLRVTDNEGLTAAGATSVTVINLVDLDKDNIPDDWEMIYFQTLDRDGTGDLDSDGLTDLEEYQNNTNPKDDDSDDDGIKDGWEVQNGLNPNADDASEDLDKDGYTNGEEFFYGTNPRDKDSKPIWKVDSSVSVSGDGAHWEGAFKTLQEAIDWARDNDQIWIKKGTYTLSTPIEIGKSVAIYGGFAGTEEERSARNWNTNIAKLDGQQSVQCMSLSADALIDGFVFTNCQASFGGAISSNSGNSSISNSRFVENNATDGGAIYAADTVLKLINCEFAKNTANAGGAVHGSNASITIESCTFTGNSASFGGAISNDSGGTFTIVNSILWGDSPKEIDNVSGTVTASYSDIDVVGGYPGEGNIFDDPRFVDAQNSFLGLRSVSPCIDVGTAPGADVPDLDLAGNTRVLDGDKDAIAAIDIGAYEYQLSSGVNSTGVFRPSNGLIYLKKENSTGYADRDLVYGIPGDIPVAGDWDGDGIDSIGIYRNGVFYLKNANETGYADMVFAFGANGDLPVAGDWDGDGIDTIGVYRDGLFMLRNSNDSGPAEMYFALGIPGDVPIAGNWDGNGGDSCGVFRPTNGLIYLKNDNSTGYADIEIVFGIPNDKPIVGDWDGDGIDTIGVYREGAFLLRNSNETGYAEMYFGLGIEGDVPISGKWGLP